jgi:hypothetical protein
MGKTGPSEEDKREYVRNIFIYLCRHARKASADDLKTRSGIVATKKIKNLPLQDLLKSYESQFNITVSSTGVQVIHVLPQGGHSLHDESFRDMYQDLRDLVVPHCQKIRSWPKKKATWMRDFPALSEAFFNQLVSCKYATYSNVEQTKVEWNIFRIWDAITQMQPGIVRPVGVVTRTTAAAATNTPPPDSAAAVPPTQTVHSHKTFTIQNGRKVHYVTDQTVMEELVKGIMEFLSTNDEASPTPDPHHIVAVDCEGVPQSLQLIQVATENAAYIFDCHQIGMDHVCKCLEPLLSSAKHIKLFHDVHQDALALHKFGSIPLQGIIDTQLVAECMSGDPLVGFNNVLSRLELPKHPNKEFVHARMKSGVDLWSKRPITQTALEYAAMDVVYLQNAATKVIDALVQNDNLNSLLEASLSRAVNAIKNDGIREICFDTKNDCYNLASSELIRTIRPNKDSLANHYKLKVTLKRSSTSYHNHSKPNLWATRRLRNRHAS